MNNFFFLIEVGKICPIEYKYRLIILASGALHGNKLLVTNLAGSRIIKNNKFDSYFRSGYVK